MDQDLGGSVILPLIFPVDLPTEITPNLEDQETVC